MDMAHVEQRGTESGRVADLLPYRQRLLQVGERRLVIADMELLFDSFYNSLNYLEIS